MNGLRRIERHTETFDLVRFTLSPEHIKLLRRANVDWDDCEFGAPAIDPKRPYGNSSVLQDIAEILGVDYDDERLREIHAETQAALQVVLSAGSFEPGEYEATEYHRDWRKVPT